MLRTAGDRVMTFRFSVASHAPRGFI